MMAKQPFASAKMQFGPAIKNGLKNVKKETKVFNSGKHIEEYSRSRIWSFCPNLKNQY